MTPKQAVIIGSGISGIATGIRLNQKGYKVSVLEANNYAGGKLHSKQHNGFRFDMGPSLFTLPHLVDELFLIHGKNPKEYFEYKKKDTICNYFWEDGTSFSMHADTEKFVREASDFFQEPELKLQSYIANNKKKYDSTRPVFLEKSLHKMKTFGTKETLQAMQKLGGLGLLGTLNQINERSFKNPKLVQLFNRYATYNGSSPYKTPGIMSLIPHLEMGIGTYFPKGGMHSITKSLVQLSKDLGIQFFWNEKAEEILVENGRAIAVRTTKNEYVADIVVSNMDIYPTFKKLLPKAKHPKKVLRQERSSSALIFYWGMNKQFPELDLHNIFFSDDSKKEFEYIFDEKTLSDDPTVYVNISSKEEPSDAPKNSENWFVMINVPANYGQDWDGLIKSARKGITAKLSRILNTDIGKNIVSELILDPRGIEKDTSSYRGSLYGAASNNKFAAFLRHPNFSDQIKSLYFCGGSVHPGGGIPLCLMSAKIVSDLIPNAK